MREIKFRAWDKEVCEMIYAGSRDGMAEHWFGFRDNNLVLFEDQQEDYPRVVDADIMQYTCLKDKNGKEIYKGDIVEFMYKNPNDTLSSKKVRCVIEFHEGAFCLVWADGYKNNARLNPEKYTVVGNIHETPELLK